MKRDWHIEDQIHKYISEEMTVDDRIAFEKLLSENKELENRVNNEKLIKLNIKKYHRSKVKKQLQRIHEKSGKRKSKVKIYLLLGKAVALMILAFWYFSQKESFSHQELYAKYYTKYTIDENQRNESVKKLNDIYTYYKNESFDVVISETEDYSMKSIPSSHRLLLGISYLEMNKLDLAKNTFKSIIDDLDVIFVEQALWYLALTELKSNKIENAKIILGKIILDKSSDHYENAKSLLDSLD